MLYDRFMDICDDAQIDWKDFLHDRDERLRLLEVIKDANNQLNVINQRLVPNSIRIVSQIAGKEV